MNIQTIKFLRAENGTISIERHMREIGATLLRISYTDTHAVVLYGTK